MFSPFDPYQYKEECALSPTSISSPLAMNPIKNVFGAFHVIIANFVERHL